MGGLEKNYTGFKRGKGNSPPPKALAKGGTFEPRFIKAKIFREHGGITGLKSCAPRRLNTFLLTLWTPKW